MDAAAFQAGRDWSKQRDEKTERAKSEANKAKALRTYLGEVDPDNKDRFNALGLAELEGLGQAFAVKTAQAKEQREVMKAQQTERSAAALARVLQDAGSLNETEMLAQGNGPVRGRQPVPMTAQRLQTVLARNPDAARSENFAPTLSALRQLIGDSTTSGAGPVEFTTDPETGTRYGFNRKTGQFGVDPNSRAKANAEVSKFSVEPIMDRFGRPAGYGVKATFGTEEEANAWAQKQNGAAKPAAQSEYKNADEVKAALKAKKLTKDAAVKILREQFGYQ